jgi:hypothetical protein
MKDRKYVEQVVKYTPKGRRDFSRDGHSFTYINVESEQIKIPDS